MLYQSIKSQQLVRRFSAGSFHLWEPSLLMSGCQTCNKQTITWSNANPFHWCIYASLMHLCITRPQWLTMTTSHAGSKHDNFLFLSCKLSVLSFLVTLPIVAKLLCGHIIGCRTISLILLNYVTTEIDNVDYDKSLITFDNYPIQFVSDII